MKVGNAILKKALKQSQGSVTHSERDRHKAYFSLKPLE